MPKVICFTHKIEVTDEMDDCPECQREERMGIACSECGDFIGKSFGPPNGSPRICIDCCVMGNTGWNEETQTWDWSA